MKPARFKYFSSINVFIGALSLRAADATNRPATQESWGTISNRWGSVLFDQVKEKAEQGDLSAQYYAAIAYSDGNGVQTNIAEAFKWMQLAAQQGMPRAERNLGGLYEDGIGVAASLDEAVAW